MVSEQFYQRLINNIDKNNIQNKVSKKRVVAKSHRIDSNFKSRMEERYARHLSTLVAAGEIVAWRYEAVGFRLAKNTFYYPDFEVVYSDSVIEFHETKGYDRQGKGRLKWKTAAEMYPEYIWKFITLDKNGWKYEQYK